MEGKIEHLNKDKGYGFIKSEDYKKNLFFHARDVTGASFDELEKGDSVSFEEIMETPKGLAAVGVKTLR